MARGDKNYDQIVRKVKNKNSKTKANAIHKMVEALIKGESEEAAEELHNYLQIKTREIIMGEACAEGEESDDKKDDDSDDDSDDKKDDDDSDDKKDDDDSDDDSDDKKDDDSDDDKKSDDKKSDDE